MKTIEMEIQCKSCHGTGVYVGMAERDGAAVVCSNCGGTGKYQYRFNYEEFTGLKTRHGVTRVYKQGYGFVIAPKELTFEGRGVVDMAKEGVSYEDFLSGVMPEHVKTLACPMLADQGACHAIKGFVDTCNWFHGGNLLGVRLSRCNNQVNKHECWERFEAGTK